MAHSVKAARLDRLRMFFRRNKWKIVASGLVMAFLLYLSSLSGVAYSASMRVESTLLYVESHPCHGYIVFGVFNISFNPFTYPITHLVGRGMVSGAFVRWSGSTYPAPQDPHHAAAIVKDDLTIEALLTEIARNLVYMGFISVIAVFSLGKLITNLRRRSRKQ